MAETPVQLVVAAFRDERGANQALEELKAAKRQGMIGIVNAAVLRKDTNGKLHIKETADMGGGKGAAFGGVVGATIGLIAGPALVVPAAVGALVGGLAAKLRDSGFSDARLKALGEGLTPGSSAIVAVVEHTWVDQVKREMQEAGADLLTEGLRADIAQQLEAGHDVAYTALATRKGFAAGRIAGDETDVEGGYIVEDESGVTGSRFVATEDGFAVVNVEGDDEGVTVEGITGFFEDKPPAEEADAEPETQ